MQEEHDTVQPFVASEMLGPVPPRRKQSIQPDVSAKPAQTVALNPSATAPSTSNATLAKEGIYEKLKLEKDRLQLDKLELDKQVSQQRLDKLKLKRLQEQQRNKALAQPALSSAAKTQQTSVATSTTSKKKTPLLAD